MEIAKYGSGKAELIIEFSLEDDGCPYPFLDTQIGSVLIIKAKVIAYECSFTVTTKDLGAALELTSINSSIAHSLSVVIKHPETRGVDIGEFNQVLRANLGTPTITVHVAHSMERSELDSMVRMHRYFWRCISATCAGICLTCDSLIYKCSFRLHILCSRVRVFK
ncbi:hypothetical protein PMAYCL1PPCAC_10224 [Pristionchus mayeri]|uniref:Uncharacterized protein n=1 Tax=Pristionchus mayeri TaxID=1317129 RepID=A0AAN4ZHK8_9BILA|nr:hypothetical protein PMAYCL1PPCAC_10224 [Pristionchus mayeri]